LRRAVGRRVITLGLCLSDTLYNDEMHGLSKSGAGGDKCSQLALQPKLYFLHLIN